MPTPNPLRSRPYPLSSDSCEAFPDVQRWQRLKERVDRAVDRLDTYLSRYAQLYPSLPFALIRSGEQALLLSLRSSSTEGPFEFLLSPYGKVGSREALLALSAGARESYHVEEALRLPFLFSEGHLYLLTVQGGLGAPKGVVKKILRRLKDALHALGELFSLSILMIDPRANYYLRPSHSDSRLPFGIYQNLFSPSPTELLLNAVAEEGLFRFALALYPTVRECGRGEGYSVEARPLRPRRRARSEAIPLYPREVADILAGVWRVQRDG